MDSQRFSTYGTSALGPPLVSNCPSCNRDLPAGALACPACHTLIHARELATLSANAERLQNTADYAGAAELWHRALTLLPPDSKQATWVRDELNALSTRTSPKTPHKQSSSDWARKFGPFGPLLLLLAKAKGLLLAIFKLKFLFSLFSFAALYWALFGWRFGVGIATSILIHEMGHYIDIRRRGLPAEMPVFLPGLGAYVKWNALGVSLRQRAEISLAGPFAGLLAAATCLVLYRRTGLPIWSALGRAGAVLNVLNLIPIWILDGAQAASALARPERLALLATALLLWAYTGEAIYFIVAAGLIWRLFTKDLPSESSWTVFTYSASVMALLGLVLKALPAPLR